MEYAICVTCGTQFAAMEGVPSQCPICEDDRQYLTDQGQQWTTLGELQAKHHNRITPLAPSLTVVQTEPRFAIGQQAHLIQTPDGNILWDCLSLLDDVTVMDIKQRGGLAAIAISHPHFYTTMVEWSQTFDAPILIHQDNQPWVMRPDDRIQFWAGETLVVLPEITLVRCGGHFPGSSVLHWSQGVDGKGALFTGDTIYPVRDRPFVSFMYSYPNLLPLPARAVRQIAAAVAPYPFDRLYGGFEGQVVSGDASASVQRSAERYIAHLQD